MSSLLFVDCDYLMASVETLNTGDCEYRTYTKLDCMHAITYYFSSSGIRVE